MGIDRQRIVKNFYPEGSTVADYFTPCEIPFACEGDKSWGFDVAAKGSSSPTPAIPTARATTKIQFRGGPRLQPEPAGHRRPRSHSSSRRTSASRPRSSCSSRPR